MQSCTGVGEIELDILIIPRMHDCVVNEPSEPNSEDRVFVSHQICVADIGILLYLGIL